MLERRRHDRSRAFQAGTIAHGPRTVPLDCVVRNLSEGGALLVLDEPRRAPVLMDLTLRGATRPARVVWRSEAAVGVAFVAASPAAAHSSPAVVSLDAVRRARSGEGDERRLAERVARFVRDPRRPD